MSIRLKSIAGGAVELKPTHTETLSYITIPETTGTAVVENATTGVADAKTFNATKGVYYSTSTVENQVIPQNMSGFSVGPVVVGEGKQVVLENGSRWVIL